MADTTDIAGIPWPQLTDEPDIEEAVRPLAEHIDTMVVPRYTTTAERDGAITAPTFGQICWVSTHGLQQYSNASAWVPFSGVSVLTVSRNTAQSIADNTPVEISFNNNDYLPWGGHSNVSTPTRVILPFPGRYMIHYGCGYASVSGTDTTNYVSIKKNGTDVPFSHAQTISDGVIGTQGSCPVDVNGTTDYLELTVLQTSGGALNTSTTAKAYPRLTAVFTGPSY